MDSRGYDNNRNSDKENRSPFNTPRSNLHRKDSEHNRGYLPTDTRKPDKEEIDKPYSINRGSRGNGVDGGNSLPKDRDALRNFRNSNGPNQENLFESSTAKSPFRSKFAQALNPNRSRSHNTESSKMPGSRTLNSLQKTNNFERPCGCEIGSVIQQMF